MKQWLSTEEALLKRSTYEAYTVYINKHIVPYFEPLCIDISALKPLQIQGYLNYKLKGGRCDGKKNGLSLISVKKHLSVLRQALSDAVLYGELQSSPAQFCKLPRMKRQYSNRCVFLSAGDAQKVVDAFAGDDKLQAAVVTALYYGLRRSEVLGLKWDAVDFESGTVCIQFTVVKNLTIEESESTKTEGSRGRYELLPEVAEALMKLSESRNSDYIFSRKDGRVMRPDTLTRSFQKGLVRYGLPKMRFHDLRHTTASILFERGWGLEDVKNWLRHADIETTSNIYLHYGSGRKIMKARELSGMLHINEKSL